MIPDGVDRAVHVLGWCLVIFVVLYFGAHVIASLI